MTIRGLKFTTKGSRRSGHHGHAGRPGSVGGSSPGGGHHTTAGVASLGRMPPISPIRTTTPLGFGQKGINGAYLVEREEGSKGIFKPVSEMEAGDPDAEVLAYELSESLGWNFVPHTEMIEHEDKEGSSQRWIEDSASFTELGVYEGKNVREAIGERMEVFDLLTGNDDRHGGNAIQDKSGKVWAIDNGFCFGFYEPGEAVSFDGIYVPSRLKGSLVLTELAQWSASGKSDDFLDSLELTFSSKVRDDFVSNLGTLIGER